MGEWTKKLAELSGMWSKQTEMLNKVTSTMVDGGGAGKGEQVNLNELDQQMEEMFVKAGDDEEDEQRHGPRPPPARRLELFRVLQHWEDQRNRVKTTSNSAADPRS